MEYNSLFSLLKLARLFIKEEVKQLIIDITLMVKVKLNFKQQMAVINNLSGAKIIILDSIPKVALKIKEASILYKVQYLEMAIEHLRA